MKTSLLTIDSIRQARERGREAVLVDPHGSIDLSNGTTALGVALALGEVWGEQHRPRPVAPFSSVASWSSGVELDRA